MRKSWLLRYPLLIFLVTGVALAFNQEAKVAVRGAFSATMGNQTPRNPFSGDAATLEAIDEIDAISVAIVKEAPVLQIPQPTITPLHRRQDDGQIQALSAQLQSLSQSATQAVSSVSSSASSAISQISQSAQSVRQSADQAVQSANQAADQANRQLSQTQSSASSAVSAANSRASDQLSQSLSSMSSRISVDLASAQSSAQSSASSAISSARVVASQFAASQIQAAKADASGVRGDANSFMNQVRANSIPASTVVIVAVASILGTAILTGISTYFLLRYRRKRRDTRDAALGIDAKSYGKPVAVRVSTSPRFPRFGRDPGSPTDTFRLPKLSPLIRAKKAQRDQTNIGFAASDYGDQSQRPSQNSGSEVDNKTSDANGAQPSTTFRLQKDSGVSRATTVRLIRVGSDKGKENTSTTSQKTDTETIPRPPPPTRAAPDGPSKQVSPSFPGPASTGSATQSSPQTDPTILSQPLQAKRSSSEQQRQSSRDLPPVRLALASRNRFKFRDSSDIESEEPTPANPGPAADTANLRIPRASNLFTPANGGEVSSTFPRRAKNVGATFATFPTLREGPRRESMIDRGRPELRPNIRSRETAAMQGMQSTMAGPQGSAREERTVERDNRDLFPGR